MNYRKIVMALVIAVVLCVVGYYAYAATVVSINEEEFYPVVSVMDGDTFKVKVGSHIITVRMLGIDTPETVDPRKPEQCYGREASDEVKKLLEGKLVKLKMNPNREEKDKFGRYLTYVYLENGLTVNEYLLKQGFAREYTYGKPYLFQNEFKDIEKEAREEKVGLWGVCLE